MATSPLTLYAMGASGGFVQIPPQPLVRQQAPTVNDGATPGTIWIDQSGNDIYVLMEYSGGEAIWLPIAAGAPVFDSVTSTTFVTATTTVAAGTTVTAGTGFIATTGALTCSNWTTYGVVVNSNAGVLSTRALTNGQLLIGSTGAAVAAATITAGAGIAVANGAGTITITATGATAVSYTCDDANVVVPDGAGNVNVVGGTNCATVGAVANTVTVNVDDAPTFAGLVTCQLGIDVSGAGATLASVTNAANAIYLHANGGANETIHAYSQLGTTVEAVNIEAAVGGITLTSGLIADDSFNIESAGGVDIDAAGQININGAENATDAILVYASNGGIDITSDGDGATAENIDITATSAVNITSTYNAAQCIYIHANAGAAESIDLHADQSTLANSINLHSDVGGITLTSGLGSPDAINIDANVAGAGGLDIDAGTGGIIADTTGAISLDGAAASNFTVTGAGIDLTLESVAGRVIVNAGEDTADTIYLHVDGGVTESIRLHSDQGTAATSIHLESDDGGVTLTSTALAAANAITLNSIAGGVDIDAALAIDIQTAQDANDALVLTATQGGINILAQGVDGGDNIDINSAQGINLESTANLAASIYLHANGGIAESIDLVASQGTGADSILLDSTAGGLTFTAALATDDAINLEATAGGIDADAALTIDIQTTEDTNDAMILTATQGGINVIAQGTDAGDDIDITSARAIILTSTGDIANGIYLHQNGGTTGQIDIHNDQGVAADSIYIVSDDGGCTIDTGLVADNSVVITTAGGLDINTDMHIDIASAEDTNDSIAILSSAGGIDITAQGADAGDDIDINSTQDVHFTSTVDMTYTVGGIYDVNSTGAVTIDSTGGAISIGADADAQNINIGTGASVRTLTIGSATGATAVAVNSGTGDITLTSTDDITLAATGDASIDSATIDLNATGGATSMTRATASVAGVATTLNARAGRVIFTGQTPASGADIDFDITNSFMVADCTVFVTVTYSGAADADITIEGVNTATAGHLILHCINSGPTQGDGNICANFWIID